MPPLRFRYYLNGNHDEDQLLFLRCTFDFKNAYWWLVVVLLKHFILQNLHVAPKKLFVLEI